MKTPTIPSFRPSPQPHPCRACEYFRYPQFSDPFELSKDHPELTGNIFMVRVPSKFDAKTNTANSQETPYDNLYACLFPGKPDCTYYKLP